MERHTRTHSLAHASLGGRAFVVEVGLKGVVAAAGGGLGGLGEVRRHVGGLRLAAGEQVPAVLGLETQHNTLKATLKSKSAQFVSLFQIIG